MSTNQHSNQWFNQFLPVGGMNGISQTQILPISTTATSIDLRTLFGNMDNGGHFTIKAVNNNPANPSGAPWRAGFLLSQNPLTLVDVGTAAAWPLLDGQEYKGHLGGGRTFATGFATMISPAMLNVKASFGSGLLCVQRSTLLDGRDLGQFKMPCPSGFPQGAPSGCPNSGP